MQIKTTAEFWKEGALYIAYAPELDMVAQGETMEEARQNLLAVIEIQFEEMQQLGTLHEFLQEAEFTLHDEVLVSEQDRVGFDKMLVSLPVTVEHMG